jgi:hypothetical protein
MSSVVQKFKIRAEEKKNAPIMNFRHQKKKKKKKEKRKRKQAKQPSQSTTTTLHCVCAQLTHSARHRSRDSSEHHRVRSLYS